MCAAFEKHHHHSKLMFLFFFQISNRKQKQKKYHTNIGKKFDFFSYVKYIHTHEHNKRKWWKEKSKKMN